MTETAALLYKNWPAICAEKNELLRLLISTTKDEDILDGLRQGFPYLFCDKQSEVHVPASALRACAKEDSLKESDRYADWDSEFNWARVVHEFNIPIAKAWGSDEGGAPAEITKQLMGQELRGGMKAKYRGIDCLVVGITDGIGPVGKVIAEPLQLDHICLVAEQFIDMNA